MEEVLQIFIYHALQKEALEIVGHFEIEGEEEYRPDAFVGVFQLIEKRDETTAEAAEPFHELVGPKDGVFLGIVPGHPFMDETSEGYDVEEDFDDGLIIYASCHNFLRNDDLN